VTDEILTLPGAIRAAAATFGEQPMIIAGDTTLSFAELDRQSAALGRGLLAAGVGKGCRIGVMMPNSPQWLVTFMAAARVGALVVPMSSLYQPPELRWVCRHADLHFLFLQDSFGHHDYIERMETACPSLRGQPESLLIDELPFLRGVFVWGERKPSWGRSVASLLAPTAAASVEMLRVAEDSISAADLLCVIYTSGSTADPKGVVHSHGKVMRHTAYMGGHYWAFSRGDRFISTRPFFWVGGLMVPVLYSMFSGAALVQPASDDPATIVELIKTQGVTGAYHSPAWVKQLEKHPAFASGAYRVTRLASDSVGFSALGADGQHRFIGAALEARIPAASATRNNSAFPNSLGMTETICTHTSLPPEQSIPLEKAGSCGLPVRGVGLRIADPITRETVANGALGELLVSGATVTEGYYKRERSETFEPDGSLATGDLCRLDEDGYLFIQGRIVDTLKVSGANVSPLEVERCLTAIPGVAEAAVFGHSVTAKDCVLIAVLIAANNEALNLSHILQTLKSSLSSFKVPKHIIQMDASEIPRTATGKIKKAVLSAKLAELPAS
jgi:acyl-coenzyme A synthetase/AMP-(fatty) acid ligase